MVRALPTEIVHHIIILSLPEETTYATYKDRYRSLLAYSLVDSKWRTLAQKELYSVLYVTESKYLKSGLLAKAQSLGGGRRLHLGVPESQWRRRDYSDAEAELPSLDGVKEVILTDLRLSEEDLMKLTDLEALHLHHCEFGTDDYEDDAWLSPSSLPHLLHLSIAPEDITDDTHEWAIDVPDFHNSLRQIGPQLKSLSIQTHATIYSDILDFHWPSFTSLQRLSLFPSSEPQIISDLLWDALERLPSGIISLHIGHPYAAEIFKTKATLDKTHITHMVHVREVDAVEWDSEVLRNSLAWALERDQGSLRELNSLVLEGCARTKEGVEEDVRKVEEAMEARGGKFVRKSGWEGGKNHLDWERYMQPW